MDFPAIYLYEDNVHNHHNHTASNTHFLSIYMGRLDTNCTFSCDTKNLQSFGI